MSTLLIRLAGPLQAWGGESKYEKRQTWRAPSKSAVIGLVASALGIRRDESIDDLLSLRFGCRVDKEGQLLRDFQTTIENGKASNVLEKYYLSDAVFLAGIEGDEALLCRIQEALANPVFPLFLGRRSCPTQGKVCLGLRDKELETALEEEPRLEYAGKQQSEALRIYVETVDETKNAYFLRDQPVSYDPRHRKYDFRRVHEYTLKSSEQKETQTENVENTFEG